VNAKVGLAIALAAAGTASLAVAAYSYYQRRWQRKSPEELERLRRTDIHQHGRLTVGSVIELPEAEGEDAAAPVVIYKYEVAGVIYEVAQDCTGLTEVVCATPWLAGQLVTVKYDPKNPSNSIIACEEWNGLPKAPALAEVADSQLSPTLDPS
jgi:hypothetical protein